MLKLAAVVAAVVCMQVSRKCFVVNNIEEYTHNILSVLCFVLPSKET